jgi:hypothetical protein
VLIPRAAGFLLHSKKQLEIKMNNEFSNWDSVEDAPEYTLIPKGDYEMLLEKVSQETVKDTDSVNFGKPRYNCQFTITDDRQNNRKIFIGFMDDNDISRRQAKGLALATNTLLVGTMCQVLLNSINKKFIANVGVSRGKNGREDSNTIWSFKPLPAAQYQPAPPPQQAYTPVPPVQPQRPANAVLGSDNKTWWIPNPASPSGWEIWQS